jgi:predicted acylesterase/phospholipase RssA
MDNKEILVLSGGSLKGIAHIGVLKALEEKNILKNIKTFAGTSVGGIVSVLYLIGYTPTEMKEIILSLNFYLMRDINIDILLNKYGVDNGKKINIVLEELLKAKNIDPNITFLELYEKTKIELIMSAVCVNDRRIIYISYKTFPNMKVIVGTRMTSCIPFWFVPIEHDGKFYIDGAVMNNYPINIFKKERKKVIGVYLNESKNLIENINNIETYLFGTMECIFEGVNNILIEDYKKQTINLMLPKIGMFELNMEIKDKMLIYNFGYEQAIKFIENKENKIKNKNI